jgi:hypothetical protein
LESLPTASRFARLDGEALVWQQNGSVVTLTEPKDHIKVQEATVSELIVLVFYHKECAL